MENRPPSVCKRHAGALALLFAVSAAGCGNERERTDRTDPGAIALDSPAVVEATATQVPRLPNPTRAPYANCLVASKFRVDRVLSGEHRSDEFIGIYWGFRGRRYDRGGFGPGTWVTN
jgi:hypothetical protein